MSIPAPLSAEDLKKLYPLTRPDPIREKSYEFALTLAGTVSAGAYTAGVLDFILEALDAWECAREAGSPDAPTHHAVLSTLTGASGGAINGAIFARVAGSAFPHGPVRGNPFYDVWVNGVDLIDLLQPSDASDGLQSVFNTEAFNKMASDLVKTAGPPLGSDGKTPPARGYLADPLRLFMMVANVTGTPYRINFRGQSKLGHDLVGHGDYMRFGLTVPGGVPNVQAARPDEFALGSFSPLNWNLVADSALATSAFPAAFPSQPLTRALDMAGYRVAVIPGEDQNTAEIAQLIPNWDGLQAGTAQGLLTTVNVDGGTINNEPLDFARIALAGYNGRNPRAGDKANRGVVMIDPFSDPEQISLFKTPGFFGLLGPLVSTLVNQARFKPEDIALATDYDTYSRFLVAPVGPGGGAGSISGSGAIASGGLDGFLGFVDKSLLDYDFRLGRRNAYDFLLNEFVLPENNAIFQGTWTADQIQTHAIAETEPAPGRPTRYLPIIPLMPALRDTPPPLAAWPRRDGVPSNLASAVAARLDSLYAALKHDLQQKNIWPGGIAAFAINQVWSLYLRDLARDKFVDTFAQGLNDQNLLSTVTQSFPKTADGRAKAEAAQQEWTAAHALSSVISEQTDAWVLTTKWR